MFNLSAKFKREFYASQSESSPNWRFKIYNKSRINNWDFDTQFISFIYTHDIHAQQTNKHSNTLYGLHWKAIMFWRYIIQYGSWYFVHFTRNKHQKKKRKRRMMIDSWPAHRRIDLDHRHFPISLNGVPAPNLPSPLVCLPSTGTRRQNDGERSTWKLSRPL